MSDKIADKARAELDHALRALDDVNDKFGFQNVGHTLWRRGDRHGQPGALGALLARIAYDSGLGLALRLSGVMCSDDMSEGTMHLVTGHLQALAPAILERVLLARGNGRAG